MSFILFSMIIIVLWSINYVEKLLLANILTVKYLEPTRIYNEKFIVGIWPPTILGVGEKMLTKN